MQIDVFFENVAGEAEIFHIYLDAVSKHSGANADVEGGFRRDCRRKAATIEGGAGQHSTFTTWHTTMCSRWVPDMGIGQHWAPTTPNTPSAPPKPAILPLQQMSKGYDILHSPCQVNQTLKRGFQTPDLTQADWLVWSNIT